MRKIGEIGKIVSLNKKLFDDNKYPLVFRVALTSEPLFTMKRIFEYLGTIIKKRKKVHNMSSGELYYYDILAIP